jgi:hypothetical protein
MAEAYYIIVAVGTFFVQLIVNGTGLLWAIQAALIWPLLLPFWCIFQIFKAIANRH